MEFEARWADARSLLEFSKPSPQLLQLRAVQHKLALINDFARAAAIKASADRLERGETAAAQERAQAAMDAEAERIMQKQHEEAEMLARWAERRTSFVESKRAIAYERVERAREFAKEEEIDFRGRLRSEAGRTSFRRELGEKDAKSCLAAPATFRRQLEIRADLGVAQLGMRQLDPAAALRVAKERPRARTACENEKPRAKRQKECF
jgi:hypothetical protein